MASAASSSLVEAAGASADSDYTEWEKIMERFCADVDEAERQHVALEERGFETHKRTAIQVWEAAEQQFGPAAAFPLRQVKACSDSLAVEKLNELLASGRWTLPEANKWAETLTRRVWSLMGFELHKENKNYFWKRISVEKPLDFNKPRKEIRQIVQKLFMDTIDSIDEGMTSNVQRCFDARWPTKMGPCFP